MDHCRREEGRVHAAHHTERHPGRDGHNQLPDLQSKRPTPASAEPDFLLAAHVPVSSCTAPRRHGRITHRPQDVPEGGTSRSEIDGRKTRGFRATSGECLTVQGEALRDSVSLRPLCGPPTHRVAVPPFANRAHCPASPTTQDGSQRQERPLLQDTRSWSSST